MRIIFFFDDTRIRTSEGRQDYTRTVYVLVYTTICHSSSGVSTSTTIFYQKKKLFSWGSFFYSYDPWIQPKNTMLISGQSIYS